MKQTISLYERKGASMTIFDQLTEGFFFMETNQIKSTDDKKTMRIPYSQEKM